jgi:DNA-binding LacI/PurR family transcriptional regulator
VVVVRIPPTPELTARLAAAGVPGVGVDAPGAALGGISVDHQAACAAMTRHLLSPGHRRIALVDRQDDPFDQLVLDARRAGYRRTLAEAALSPRSDYEPPSEWSAAGGGSALDRLLSLHDPPTAVLCGSDTQAIGMLERARRRGLQVPGDLAVCGYGDVELAGYLDLTTVRVPIRRMGQRAIERVVDAIEGNADPGLELLGAELVVRGSGGVPRQA